MYEICFFNLLPLKTDCTLYLVSHLCMWKKTQQWAAFTFFQCDKICPCLNVFFSFFSITPKAHNNSWMDIPTVSRGQAQCYRGHASARSVTSCSLIHLPRRGEDTHNTGRKKRRKHSWEKKCNKRLRSVPILSWTDWTAFLMDSFENVLCLVLLVNSFSHVTIRLRI